jgi:LytS/YehU family sensor histidine kinase
MTLTDDKLEADRFISKFSKLMRETLQKSDKITTTLQEEIDYVENYIQLQQIRFNNGFNYQLKKGLNVDYRMQVPNHVIYTYVENAIKHGLSGHSEDNLSINICPIPEGISILIENNGGGIDTSSVRKKNSTGNGMKIMEKMYTLYEKLYHKKITHQMTEIKDKEGNITGVSIKVIISK